MRRNDGTSDQLSLSGRAVDAALETTVAGSFSRIGITLRRRTQHWTDPPRMDGRAVVVTGGSSGIGLAAAVELGRLGASVWVVGRDPDRTRSAARRVADAGAPWTEAVVADLALPDALDAIAARVADRHDQLDGLVHGAGALLRRYETTPNGTERTVATQVLGPFRLTWQLGPLLRAAERSVVVTVTSGGMYAERFDLDDLVLSADGYDGVRAYARAKRAQVVLSHEWARRWSHEVVASYAVHPGWVDTPGLATGLPSFTRLGPLLRRPEEGADTAVWLVAGGPRGARLPAPLDGLWLDRHRRHEHYLPWTRSQDPEGDQRRLWAWCVDRCGLGVAGPPPPGVTGPPSPDGTGNAVG